jgi:hypothetical protein
MTLQIEINPRWLVGDIIKVEGRNYKITKLTTTALAVERYYWFDRLWDKYVRKQDE